MPARKTKYRLTATSRRIMDLLAHGQPVSYKVLAQQALDDPQASQNAVAQHITIIRSHINPEGYDILCRYFHQGQGGPGLHYQLVRLLASPYNGHK